MATKNNLTTYFFPHLRRGLGAGIDPFEGKAKEKRASVDVKFKVKAQGKANAQEEVRINQKVSLYGPGDVLGFDPERMIIRVQPTSDDGNFIANNVPFVDFAEADFLWRYSATQEKGKWIPWLSLITLEMDGIEKDGEFEFDPKLKAGLPPRIKLKPGAILPNLKASWRWAHLACQGKQILDAEELKILAEGLKENQEKIKKIQEKLKNNETAIKNKIQNNPAMAISRLLCPRRLSPGVKYCAFIVPTYLLGVEAALGVEATETHRGQLAWEGTAAKSSDLIAKEGLPYYYKWEFHTGLRGDFEQLIRLVKPSPIKNLGGRTINIDNPGYGFLYTPTQPLRTMELEGALQSSDNNATDLQKNPLSNEETKKLADLLSKAEASDENGKTILDNNGNSKLLVVPSIYGRWINYNEKKDLNLDLGKDPKKYKETIYTQWLKTLNLDLKYRIAAGLGVQYVKAHQEELMQSAWSQLEKNRQLNQQLNLGRAGREISNRLHTRLSQISDTFTSLSFTAPVHNKIKMRLPMARSLQDSSGPTDFVLPPIKVLPPNLGFPPFSPIPIQIDIPTFLKEPTIGAQFKISDLSNTSVNPKLRKYLPKGVGANRMQDKPIGFFDETFRHSVIVPELMGSSRMQNSARKIDLETTKPFKIVANEDIRSIQTSIIYQLQPTETIEKRLEGRLEELIQWSRQKRTINIPINSEDPIGPAMTHPEFHAPMYRYLLELSKDYLLPGLDKVPQNTVSALMSNREFIEAFMMGLNHEFAAELRWRGFPTDLRGSYFRKFWDSTIYSMDGDEKVLFRTSVFGIQLLAQLGKKESDWVSIENAYFELSDDTIAGAYETAVEKWLLTRNEDKDISRLHQWSEATLLGKHSPQTTKNEELVLLIRAEFIRKYPNTLTYLVEKDSKGKPILSDAKKMAFPIFEAQLPPDILCLGFPFDEAEARKRHIVFEERLSEHRFGLDDASAIEMVAQSTGKSIDQVLAEASIENLSWQHFPAVGPGQYLDDQPPSKANPKIQNKWAAGGAPYSAVAFTQKQVRVVVDLDKLLPL